MQGMDKNTGRLITDEQAHVRQSIDDIITTPINSRIMRRDYGSLLPELIDHPLNTATILKLIAATAMAILHWEPRFKLKQIKLSRSTNGSAMIEVIGSINDQSINVESELGGRSI
jgi:phage baseplate assembly protein W